MKKRDLITVIFIAGIVSFFYYGPFLDNYFVWDDFWMLENYYKGNLKDFLFGFADLRIFGNLILWLNCVVSEQNPVSYSLIRIAAHTANSAMLFLLIQSLSNNRLLSIFTAIIFAASAVGCDAIYWKDAFLTVTGLFFYILILYLYVEGKKRNNRFFQSMALFVFLLAMFNKEEIASVPFMIIFIEMLFFRDGAGLIPKLKRLFPYLLVIVIYIVLSISVSRFLNLQQEQFDRFLSFRPLHMMFSGFASFFISPDGFLDWKNPSIYITASLILFYFILIKDRRMLLFGIVWASLTFIPQSLTGGTGYDPTYLFNSISRHLYLPSVGPAIVFSVILLAIKERFTRQIFVVTTALFFAVFILLNYERANMRGQEWQEMGMIMKGYLYSLKEIQPTLPENTYIRILNGPGGRSYGQRALRGFYRNPKIYWADDFNREAYIYLYLNGRLLDNHESIMQMGKDIKTEDIGSVMKFYDLKGWEVKKLEFLHAISTSLPDDAETHVKLALNYRDMKMYDDAISEYKAALAIKPSDLNIHYRLGMIYMAKGEYDLAIKEFELAKAKEFVEYVEKVKGIIVNEK